MKIKEVIKIDTIIQKTNLLFGDPEASPEINSRYPYRLLYQKDGIYTAYYFSVPIFCDRTQSTAPLRFAPHGNGAYLDGVRSGITLGEDICMENPSGKCRISMPSGYRYESDGVICYEGVEVYPTLNGVACLVRLGEERKYVMRVSTDASVSFVKHNRKCFCTMLSDIVPHLNISCVGAFDGARKRVSPACIQYRKTGEREYEVAVLTDAPEAEYLFFEINLHTPKLFLDTTVESKNPDMNNAFGTAAFIGQSRDFGEQWLYCRPLSVSFGGLKGAIVKKAVFYIPKLDSGNTPLAAYPLGARFCSFTSNWNNKKSPTYNYVQSEIKKGYHVIDLSEIMVKNEEISKLDEGWVLKTAPESDGFCAISTADSFFAPQILEVVFERNN